MTGIKTPYLSVIIKFISTNFFVSISKYIIFHIFTLAFMKNRLVRFVRFSRFVLLSSEIQNRRRLGIAKSKI